MRSPALAFSIGEYTRRRRLAEAAVAAQGLDAFLTTILGNICWLTGFQTIASYGFTLYATLIDPGRDVVLVSSDFESHNATLDSWVTEVRTYAVMADPIDALVGLVRDRGLERARLGIETGYGALTVGQAAALRQRLPDVEFSNASGTIERLRAVSSNPPATRLARVCAPHLKPSGAAASATSRS